MTEKEIKSQRELYEFVEFHDLQDSNSQINFSALVSIFTAKSELEKEEMNVWILKDVFNRRGKVSIVGSDLDPYEFPEEFFPDFQLMKHVEMKYLKIDGNHPNERIGKYTVEIYPIKRLRD